MRRLLVAACLCGFVLAGAGPAWAGPRCTKYTELTSLSDTSILGAQAILCSVQLFATAANASCVVFDSPSAGDSTHGQSTVVSEPGVATAGESQSHYFGPEGIPTVFGLGGRVKNGRCIVSWGGTP